MALLDIPCVYYDDGHIEISETAGSPGPSPTGPFAASTGNIRDYIPRLAVG